MSTLLKEKHVTRIAFVLLLAMVGCSADSGVPSGVDLAPEAPDECPKALPIYDVMHDTTTTEMVSAYPGITFASAQSAHYLGQLIAPLRVAAKCADITLTVTTFMVTVTPPPDTLSSTYALEVQQGGQKIGRLSGLGGGGETNGYAWRGNLPVANALPAQIALVCVGKCSEALQRRRIEVCLGGADWDRWTIGASPREYALQKPGTDCLVQNL